MLNMIIGKRSHRIIRMIIIRLVSNSQAILSSLFSRSLEVLWKELALFVEVVAGSLYIGKKRKLALKRQKEAKVCT